MDEEQQAQEQVVPVGEAVDLEALIALVEARVIENLTRVDRADGAGARSAEREQRMSEYQIADGHDNAAGLTALEALDPPLFAAYADGC